MSAFEPTAFASSAFAAGVDPAFEATAFEATAFVTGEGGTAVRPLHGRKLRGKRVYFPDELDPIIAPEVVQAAIAAVELPQIRELADKIEQAKRQAEVLFAKLAKEREAKARQQRLDALADQIELVVSEMEATKAREQAWIARLRDEDDFFFLAA